MRSHWTAGSFKLAWLPLSLGATLLGPAREVRGQESPRPVPRAACGPQDRPERVQGQTTLAERFSPGPAQAYTCNLELVGQFEGEGASADLEVFGTCAYYSTAANPQMRHPGVAVLDVSDARQPTATAYLDSPAMRFALESMEIHPARKLLLASKPPALFDLYDLSADCRHPVLKRSVSLPGRYSGLYSHEGQFAPDGLTFYGAKWPKGSDEAKAAPPRAAFAIDVSNPANPRGIAVWTPPKAEWITHTVSVNTAGTRVYLSLQRLDGEEVNGLVILDVSEIQARRPNPQFRLISTLFWDDTYTSGPISPPVMIKGRPYLIYSDAAGAVGNASPPPAGACASGKPGHGFARIIDLGDEQRPKTVAKLMLEVSDPANCATVRHDPFLWPYGSFGCDVDHDANAQLLACGYYEGGLRVFDIREPSQPREVAYYKPPARRLESRPGSLSWYAGSTQDRTADAVIVAPRFRKDGAEIWFTSADNGFQVVRFTDRFHAAHPALFRK